MVEQLTDNINDVYDRIRDDNTTRTKEIAVKNIDSDEYPTTDTYVRVRLVPMIVYVTLLIKRDVISPGATGTL